ncbi:MAG: hypothetical protein A4E32_00016 [Methanomassiliicoccales archaeon PtaU1.Bin124]|nr:MAG: hypothetical protein A4E32_00016 [Methanomassiliicoccales archaeon PtaU1.Bin124]
MGKYRLRGVKNTPKVLERDLIENAKKLARDPDMILPKCSGEQCRKCRFAKVERKLLKIRDYADNPDKLIKFASKGDQIVRAYAATISLSAAGKIPFLTSAQLPTGEVSFAVRGTVDKEKLIGMQHFDDPDLRLLIYWDMARKYDLHIYATQDGVFCSADGPKAPKEYVDEMLRAIDFDKATQGCGHLDKSHISVKWVSAGLDINICEDCVDEENVVHDLSSRIAAPDHTDDFRSNAVIKFNCKAKQCGKCDSADSYDDLGQKHRQGQLNDKQFLAEASDQKRQRLRGQGVYVLGSDCFGQELDLFLANVKGSEIEMRALSCLLKDKKIGVVSDGNVASKIISDLWPDHAVSLLSAVASPDVVEKMKGRDDQAACVVLAEASRMNAAKAIEGSLPTYRSLGDIGRLADAMARAYKTEGREALLRIADRSKGKDHRSKSVCYAFFKAIGETSKSWQFNKQEADFGEYLSQFASIMIQAKGNEYDDALKNLVTASGANETVA